jgi:FkbM family methyltransferase
MFNRSRKAFDRINMANGLALDYSVNQTGTHVLESIFVKREYADYFPFYESAVIVDVGAHYGYFSLFASLNSGSGSQIFSLEPDPGNLVVLRQNLKDCKINNVVVIDAAIGAEEGKMTLYGGSEINRSLFGDYALGSGKEIAQVNAITLGKFVQQNNLTNIDFLKLDCEGSEYSILLNADDDTLRKFKTISMEFHDMKKPGLTANNLRKRLIAAGFSIVKFAYESSNFGLNYGKLIATR